MRYLFKSTNITEIGDVHTWFCIYQTQNVCASNKFSLTFCHLFTDSQMQNIALPSGGLSLSLDFFRNLDKKCFFSFGGALLLLAREAVSNPSCEGSVSELPRLCDFEVSDRQSNDSD